MKRYTTYPEPIYACPICLGGFTEADLNDGKLTLEHVPPKSLGGKGLVLTCAECNTTAGHSVDAALHRRQDQIRFADALAGKADYSGRVRMSVDDRLMNFDLKKAPAGPLELAGSGNPPDLISRFIEIMNRHVEEGTWEGSSFDITLSKVYSRTLAKSGDLRIAFLLAFALLGYRYVLDSRLERIRAQIRRPEAEVVSGFWVQLNGEAGQTIALVEQPVRVIAVTLGFQAVLLPRLDGPEDPYAELRDQYPRNEPITMQGDRLRWPMLAEFGLDKRN